MADLGNTETYTQGDGNKPEFLARGTPMTDDDLAVVVRTQITDAVQYAETELSPERVRATEYYHGKPFGNEEQGRSQAVLTEVRDNILGVLPALLRVLHGPEHTVDFVPTKGASVEMAAQATDYVRYVYEADNQGFLVTHSVLKDGLTKKLGVLKWGMDETPERRTTLYRGLSREELAAIAEAPNAEIVSIQQVGQNEMGPVLDAEVSIAEPSGRLWVIPVPPDDFFWNREARSLKDATVVGHRARLTHGELRALGIPQALIDEYGGSVPVETDEEQARRTAAGATLGQDPPTTEENRRTLYTESYHWLDMRGTGTPELRRICSLGNTYHPIKNVPVDTVPFAMFCPDPEPHAMLGGSWYDLLKDAQKINSQLMRGMLDSLSISLFPRTAYVDGQVSVADILNTAIGAPIRMRQPGMVQTFEQPFTGEKVMPVMAFMRDVVERRVGQKDGAGSLDLDALQSTNAGAVDAAIQAAQSQAELLARLYCEQVFKPMYQGLLKLVAHPASKERIIRLRGTYVPMLPATWDASMDVTVNVALGSMDPAKKIAALDAVIADQTALLAQLGPDNPVITVPMLRNAKAKRLELTGIKDVDNYYKPLPPDWQPPPPPPPEPSEEDKWRQAEKEMAHQKAMAELAIAQDKLALEREKALVDAELRKRELALAEVDSVRKNDYGPHNAEIERYKVDREMEIKVFDIRERSRIEELKLGMKNKEIEVESQTKIATATINDTQAEQVRQENGQ